MGKDNQAMDELLVKYLTGEADEKERTLVLEWIHGNKEHENYFYQLREVYEAAKITQPFAAARTDLSWERVKARHFKDLSRSMDILPVKKSSYVLVVWKYAAIVIVVSLLSILIYRGTSRRVANPAQAWNVVQAPLGSRSFVTLSDGTSIWLNAGSKLFYPASFGDQSRDVTLEGEAYFHVTKYRKMQFRVITSHVRIRVMGTEFNVKAYPEENTVQTTLVKGSVVLENTVDGKEIHLKPNQSAIFIRNKEDYEKEKSHLSQKKERVIPVESENILLTPNVDPVVYTSWKDNRWIIEGESLASLAIKLGKRFNMTFIFDSEALKNYQFSGTLKNETLEQVLNLIKLSAPIDYTIKGGTVRIKNNDKYKKAYDELLIAK